MQRWPPIPLDLDGFAPPIPLVWSHDVSTFPSSPYDVYTFLISPPLSPHAQLLLPYLYLLLFHDHRDSFVSYFLSHCPPFI
jgi:hypothetical protein